MQVQSSQKQQAAVIPGLLATSLTDVPQEAEAHKFEFWKAPSTAALLPSSLTFLNLLSKRAGGVRIRQAARRRGGRRRQGHRQRAGRLH